jgi:hypothetical protein
MAKCDYCGSTILFGGQRDGDLRFCNDKCHQAGVLLAVADQVPEEAVQQYIQASHAGNCPKCNGQGPIDVHTSHKIWSLILLTSWNSQPQICCRSCGIKGQLGASVFSLLVGWWGFPWGLIMTPVQLIRNVGGMVSGPDPSQPSEQLEKLLRLELAARLVEANQQQAAG